MAKVLKKNKKKEKVKSKTAPAVKKKAKPEAAPEKKKKKSKEEQLGAEKTKKQKPASGLSAGRPAKKDPRKGKKKEVMKIVTPIGRVMFKPYLVTPDERNTRHTYNITLGFDKKTWQEEGRAMRKATIKTAQKYYEDDSLTLDSFQHSFRDGATMDYESCKDKVVVGFTANVDSQPPVVGPGGQKDVLKEKDIAKIKAGDFVRVVGNPYGYDVNGNTGIAWGLNVVQFSHAGDPISGGNTASLKMLDELEVTLDDIEDEDDNDDSDSDDSDDVSDDDSEDSSEDEEESDSDDDDTEDDDDSDDDSEDDDDEDDSDDSDDDDDDDSDSDEDDDDLAV